MSYCPKFNVRGKHSKVQDVNDMDGIHRERLSGLGPASRAANWGKKTGSPHADMDDLLTRPNFADDTARIKGAPFYG